MASRFVRLLGPVQIVDDDRVVDLPSPTQRRLLALLALAAGTTQRTQYLCDVLDLSGSALRTTVHRLRARVGEDLISTDTVGYRISCGVDVAMFADLLVARDTGKDRLADLDDALGLWRGEVLDEFRDEPWAVAEVARLDELRALAVEERAELLLSRHRSGDAVAALTGLVAVNPFRDRAQGLLIQALAGDGRRAEALRAYQRYRTQLVEETGTEPSARVQSLERRVAAGEDDDAEAPPVGGGRGGPAPGSEAAFTFPLSSQLAGATELIGRRREITWLESELVAARAGTLRVALLGGASGIGKTTLIAAFANAQHRRGGTVVAFGRCVERAPVPLEPFRTILEDIVEHAPLDLLRAHSERCGGELLRAVPRLADRVWVPPPVEADEAIERHRLFEAIVDLLRRVASAGSLTLVLDDVHWADATALLLLRHVVRALADAPVLVIVSYRDTAPEPSPELRSALVDLDRARARRLALVGFDDAEMAALLSSSIATERGPVREVIAHLQEETAGNPLFASQLAQHLWETGVLRATAGEIGFGDTPSGTLPRNLRDVVWSRVEALDPPAPDVLRAAALLGSDVDVSLLGSLTGLDDEAVAEALDRAMAAGLVVSTGVAARPVRFVHGLVHHALDAELSPIERQRLHACAAELIEGRADSPGPDDTIDLARHAQLAGDLAAAQRWATVAAEHAAAQLAAAEAASWRARALALAEERGAPAAERAELMVLRGEAQRSAGDPQAHQVLLEAAATARRSGAHATVVRAALANDRGFSRVGTADHDQLDLLEDALAVADPERPTDVARLLACQAQELVHTPETQRRLASARGALALVDASDDPSLLPSLVSALVCGLWGPDTLELRATLAGRAVEDATRLGDPVLEFSTRRVAYYVAIESGDAVAANTSARRMRRIAEDIGAPHLRWFCAVIDAFDACMQARFADADTHAERVLELGTEIGEPDAFGMFAGLVFVTRSFAGRYDEVLPLLEQAIADTPDSLPFRLALAIGHAVTGRTDEPRRLLEEAAATGFATIPENWTWMTTVLGYAVLAIELEHAEAAAQLFPLIEPFGDEVAFNGATSQGPVGAYLGKLASLIGRHDEAEAHLTRALALTRTFGWRYHEATTLLALARAALRRTGSLDDGARAHLDEAGALASEFGIGIVASEVARLRAGAVSL